VEEPESDSTDQAPEPDLAETNQIPASSDHDVSDPGITLAESDSTDEATESDLAARNQIPAVPAVPAEAEEVTATDAEGEADAGS